VVPNIRDERRRNTRDDLRSVIFDDVLLGTEAMMFLFIEIVTADEMAASGWGRQPRTGKKV